MSWHCPPDTTLPRQVRLPVWPSHSGQIVWPAWVGQGRGGLWTHSTYTWYPGSLPVADNWIDEDAQTQDSKLEPWWSEAERATSRSQRFPAMLNRYEWAGKKHLHFFKGQIGIQTLHLRLSKQAALTTAPGPLQRKGQGQTPLIAMFSWALDMKHSSRHSASPYILSLTWC